MENALALRGLAGSAEVTLINLVPSAVSELLRGGAAGVRADGEPGGGGAVVRAGAARGVSGHGQPGGEPVRSVGDDDVLAFSEVAGTEGTPSVGRPVRGTRAYVLDRALRPVPLGGGGGALAGGRGSGPRLLRPSGLDRGAVYPDPFGRGERLYRTGDLVRTRPDGELQYLGRRDHQVKVRGFRIELEEVEAALLAIPPCWRPPWWRADRSWWVRGAGGGWRFSPALAAFLQQRLPGFMVPTSWVLLAGLPRTPNGKLDRAALPPRTAPRGGERAMPRGPVEQALVGLWAEVLGLDEVGVDESFFEIGGHSLLAMRLISRLRGAFGIELSVADLFEAPTPAQLAERIACLEEGLAPAAAPPLLPVPDGEDLPLSLRSSGSGSSISSIRAAPRTTWPR